MKYTKVRNDFLERRDLTVTQKIILIYLYGRMRRDGQPWQVDREQIWTALDLGQDATKTALRGLKADGWITDNRAAVCGPDGRWRRVSSTVIESRKSEIVAPDSEVSTDGGFPTVGKPTVGNPPSNEEPSNEGSNDEGSSAVAASSVDESAPFDTDEHEVPL